MNKYTHFCCLGIFLPVFLIAQNPPVPPSFVIDTILFAPLPPNAEYDFEPFPNGNDTTWVNYDVDGLPQSCFEEDTYGWIISQGICDTSVAQDNYAFSSCSWLDFSPDFFPCPKKNRNWLIMPPLYIDGSTATLEWKSLSAYGPAIVDGYMVLVSKTDNFIESFTDTIFTASQMIKAYNINNLFSLDTNAYQYSPGYVHANKYAKQEYFTTEYDPASEAFFFQGCMEPHSVSLSEYLGHSIYIAFLHNSDCDFVLQIDDILVTDDQIVTTKDPAFLGQFKVSPNPSDGPITIDLKYNTPQNSLIQLLDITGKVLWETQLAYGSNARLQPDFSQFQPGFYSIVVKSSAGQAYRKLVLK